MPYCILSTGPHEVFTTGCAKHVRNPLWNEFFELLVKKQRDKILEVSVMARDNEGDVFLGSKRTIQKSVTNVIFKWVRLTFLILEPKQKMLLLS